jgi:hypothetical protein
MGMLTRLAAIALVLGATSGCIRVGVLTGAIGPSIQGSGVKSTETRDVPGSSGVRVMGAITAEVALGEKPSVVISGDDNIVPLVVTEVVDDTLVIRMKDNTRYAAKEPLKATITATSLVSAEATGAVNLTVQAGSSPHFRGEASGASSLTVNGLDTPKLELGASGASTVTAYGKAASLMADASGASTLHLSKLEVESARVNLSGASKGTVHAARSIEGDASGASSLKVAGQPATRKVSKSGASSVSYEAEP